MRYGVVEALGMAFQKLPRAKIWRWAEVHEARGGKAMEVERHLLFGGTGRLVILGKRP